MNAHPHEVSEHPALHKRCAVVGGVRRGSRDEYWYDAISRKVLTRARRDSLYMAPLTNSCASYIGLTVWAGDHVRHELRGAGSDASTAAALSTDVSTAVYDYGKVGYVPKPMVAQPSRGRRIATPWFREPEGGRTAKGQQAPARGVSRGRCRDRASAPTRRCSPIASSPTFMCRASRSRKLSVTGGGESSSSIRARAQQARTRECLCSGNEREGNPPAP